MRRTRDLDTWRRRDDGPDGSLDGHAHDPGPGRRLNARRLTHAGIALLAPVLLIASVSSAEAQDAKDAAPGPQVEQRAGQASAEAPLRQDRGAKDVSPAGNSIDDASIRDAVVGELFAAKGVPGAVLDVVVTDGVVTLSGKVGDLLSKERAVRVATLLKGVRGVVDQIEVREHGLDDGAIRQRIDDAFVADPATDSWELTAKVERGVATLTGTVQSYAERELAGTVAKGVHGVREVVNDVTVAYKADRSPNEVEQDVRQRLAWDARLDDHAIDVSYHDGTLTLTGTVGSEAARRQAIEDAWVAGVSYVAAEDLVVEWWARDPDLAAADRELSDDAIHDAVIDTMAYDPRVLSFRPEVAVVNGVVTLTGSVDSVKARRAAAEDARNTVGVRRVRNHLRVDPPGAPTAAAIEVNARNALARDAIVHEESIEVSVHDGTVRLEGHVPSYFMREQAEDVVARVAGVTDIENLLSIDYTVPRWTFGYHDWDPVLWDFDFDYRTVRVKPDRDIEEDIQAQLWWSPFVDEDQVNVDVEQGVATLTGTVDSVYERSIAADNAIEGGAVRVVNELHVASTTSS